MYYIEIDKKPESCGRCKFFAGFRDGWCTVDGHDVQMPDNMDFENVHKDCPIKEMEVAPEPPAWIEAESPKIESIEVEFKRSFEVKADSHFS